MGLFDDDDDWRFDRDGDGKLDASEEFLRDDYYDYYDDERFDREMNGEDEDDDEEDDD